jgi:hypothetical protein
LNSSNKPYAQNGTNPRGGNNYTSNSNNNNSQFNRYQQPIDGFNVTRDPIAPDGTQGFMNNNSSGPRSNTFNNNKNFISK